MDRLSQVFDLVEVRGVLSGGFAARDRWYARAEVRLPLKFLAVPYGKVWLSCDGLDSPVLLEAGDVAILQDREWLRLEGGRTSSDAGNEETGKDSGDARRVEPGMDSGVESGKDSGEAGGVESGKDSGEADGESCSKGNGRAGSDGEAPIEVMPEEGFAFEIQPELDDVVIGGRIDVTPAGRRLLLDALPPVAVVRSSTPGTNSLRGCIHRITDEMTGGQPPSANRARGGGRPSTDQVQGEQPPTTNQAQGRRPPTTEPAQGQRTGNTAIAVRPGAAFAIRQHGQLLLLEVLRAFLAGDDLPPGWLSALRDERLRPALDLMHDHPERAWGLQELARAAAMSRTTFAERFRAVAGVPPLTYLTQWRMLLAQQALRDGDVRIGSLAAELGYASEAAFSTAFKREVGEAPLRFRNRLRPVS
ncbi:helix-turn-helix transcriptional regulator [Actinoplanes sp. LDG1-06]|uniref:Helix-turn-helix transcriptional regulator n=1 Tax=Paractinoplanes ovalisporus TaxID=2810368 RepID=A0ABS2A2U2_9ACTN|nr:AraC family transcriptional regulator [Actinoplanes ovalisporus]MBM2614155.1 helix-turn-helix transcriptional regulator [Actinoplanes ovalisporus]